GAGRSADRATPPASTSRTAANSAGGLDLPPQSRAAGILGARRPRASAPRPSSVADALASDSGTSLRPICSTNSSLRWISAGSWPEPQSSLAGTQVPGLSLPLRYPLASGSRTITPKSWSRLAGRTKVLGYPAGAGRRPSETGIGRAHTPYQGPHQKPQHNGHGHRRLVPVAPDHADHGQYRAQCDHCTDDRPDRVQEELIGVRHPLMAIARGDVLLVVQACQVQHPACEGQDGQRPQRRLLTATQLGPWPRRLLPLGHVSRLAPRGLAQGHARGPRSRGRGAPRG